MVFKISEDV